MQNLQHATEPESPAESMASVSKVRRWEGRLHSSEFRFGNGPLLLLAHLRPPFSFMHGPSRALVPYEIGLLRSPYQVIVSPRARAAVFRLTDLRRWPSNQEETYRSKKI